MSPFRMSPAAQREIDPRQLFEQLQRRLRSVSHLGLGLAAGDYPPVNIYRGEEEAVVSALVPGVSLEKLDITVVENRLEIKGTGMVTNLRLPDRFHKQERESGEFARTIQLPFSIDADKVDASLSRGVLTIKLPRCRNSQFQKIPIHYGGQTNYQEEK